MRGMTHSASLGTERVGARGVDRSEVEPPPSWPLQQPSSSRGRVTRVVITTLSGHAVSHLSGAGGEA